MEAPLVAGQPKWTFLVLPKYRYLVSRLSFMHLLGYLISYTSVPGLFPSSYWLVRKDSLASYLPIANFTNPCYYLE